MLSLPFYTYLLAYLNGLFTRVLWRSYSQFYSLRCYVFCSHCLIALHWLLYTIRTESPRHTSRVLLPINVSVDGSFLVWRLLASCSLIFITHPEYTSRYYRCLLPYITCSAPLSALVLPQASLHPTLWTPDRGFCLSMSAPHSRPHRLLSGRAPSNQLSLFARFFRT